jgi:hypothetical protein
MYENDPERGRFHEIPTNAQAAATDGMPGAPGRESPQGEAM